MLKVKASADTFAKSKKYANHANLFFRIILDNYKNSGIE
jgi:hypothetical protein